MTHIGELNEQPLHAALKAHYAAGVHPVEVAVDGYIIDVQQADRLVEIQTANFSSIRDKLIALARDYTVRLVYPVAYEKWLYKLPKPGWEGPRRRKSPKRGRWEAVFGELVSFPHLLKDPHFSLEVLMIHEEEVRRYAGEDHWYRNGWVVVRRELLKVLDRWVFQTPADFLPYLPASLPEAFTTADLARAGEMPRWLSQKMAYCLRKMGAIQQIGKKGRSHLYRAELSVPEKEEEG
jgi:hypothetical protein